MLTEEQIEQWLEGARDPNGHPGWPPETNGHMIDLCKLALRGLETLARPEEANVTAEKIKALPRITPSELGQDERWRRNDEYVSLYEVLDLFQPSRAPQQRDDK